MKTFPALPLFRIGRTKLFALLGLGLGLSGALSRLQAVTLQVGDILVSDSGTNAANTKLYQLPVSGTPPLTPVVVTSQSVGTDAGGADAIDWVKLSAAASPTVTYYYDGTRLAIYRVDPSNGNRTLVSGGATAPQLTQANTLEMVWDQVGGQLLINYGGTARGIVAVNVTTGARTYLTGNGVGGGTTAPTANIKGLTVSVGGAIYMYDQNGLVSVNRSNGDRTLVSAVGNFGTVVATGGLGYDESRGLILVSDVNSSAALAAIKWVSSGGAITVATGGTSSAAPGSGTAFNLPRFPIADSSGNIYYRESNKDIIKVTNPGASNVRSIYSAAANYTAITGSNLTIIRPAPPVISSSLTASGTYGSAISTYTITASGSPTSYGATGLPAGLSLNTSNGQITGTPTTTTGSPFSVTIRATNAGGTGSATLVFTVAKKALTVTANAASRAYFASNPTFTGTITGFVNGDTVAVVSGAASFATNATSTSAAGGSYTITPSVGTLSATNYSFTTFNTAALTITKVALTVTANAASRAYFASNPSFTASYSGFVNSETASVISGAPGFTTNATSTSPAGGSYTITPAVGTLSATNYSFGTFNTGVLTITKVALTVTANAASRAYFASNPSFTASYSGFVNSETASVISGAPGFTTNATSTSPAGGSYTITPAVGTLSAANYSFGTFNTGVLTITKVPLTVTANAASRAYGAADPSFTASYSGFVNSETTAVLSGAPSFTTDATSTSPAGGSYTITPAVGTLSAANYSFGTFNTGVLTITKVPLTVTANAASRAYGAADPSFTASYSGFVNSETTAVLSGAPSFTTDATSTSSAGGSYTITPAVGTLSAANYSFSTFNTGTLTITKVALTVTANAASRAYGAADPSFTASYSGFVNSETTAVLSGAPSFTTDATSTSSAGGSYTITPAVGTLSAANYSFSTFNTGTLTITKVALTVTANAASRAYGAVDPSFTASYSGFVNSETTAVLSGAPSFTTDATSTSPAGGSYTITPAVGTLSATNYSFGTFNTGTLTITKVALTVTANAASRAYGAADPSFTASYSGFVNSETTAVLSGAPSFTTDATSTSPAGGSYTITPAVGTLSATNYSFTPFNTGVLTITKAPLTVTAADATRAYFAADPTFSATITGFANGESLATSDVTGSPSFSTNASSTSSVGSYLITPAAGSLSSSNYSFTFATGALTITKVGLTVTADAASRAYGASDPAFTASYSGFVNSETASVISGAPGFSTDATATSAPGSGYTITPAVGTLSATNYAFTTFHTGALTITKATLTVTAADASRVFGVANPTFSATYSGFANGETPGTSDVTGSPAISTGATVTSAAGDYAITPTLGSLNSSNYSFAFADGTLTISSLTYAAWKTQVFTVGEQADSAISGPDADPDNDGMINLLEYAFALDPMVSDRTALPTIGTVVDSGSTYAALTYPRRLGTSDLLYDVQASANLSIWSTSGVVETGSTDLGTTESATARDGSVLGTGSRRFLRVLVTSTSASQPAASDPLGAVAMTMQGAGTAPGGRLNLVGLPLTEPVVYQGRISSVSGSTLVQSGATWGDDAFNGANGTYFVEIASGTNAGLMLDIVATSASAHSLTLGSSVAGYASTGDVFKVRRHWTLADVFGATNAAGLIAGALNTADLVQVYVPSTQTYTSYYYSSGGGGGTGWRSDASVSADAAATPLYFDEGFLVRKQTAALTWILTGAVKTGPTILTVAPGTNFLPNVYPAGTLTLSGSQIYTGSATTGLAGGSLTTADLVSIHNPTTGIYTNYYYKTTGLGGTGWRANTSPSTDAAGTSIPTGGSLLLQRKAAGAFLWHVPQPF